MTRLVEIFILLLCCPEHTLPWFLSSETPVEMPHLRVSFIPFMFLVSLDDGSQLGGLHGGVFDAVCSLMNTTYVATMPPEITWGDCNETKCSGMFDPLLTNDSDIALGPHSLLNTYAQHFEPGTPVSFEQLEIVTGMRRAYGVDSASVLKVLDTGMYVLLILLPWIVAGLVILATRLQRVATFNENLSEELDPGVLVIAGYQTILNQSGQYSNKLISSRLVVMSYIVVALFLTILYSSFVKASMMVTPPTKRISRLRELVREKNLRPIVPAKTFVTDLIRLQAEANADYFKLNQIFEERGLADVRTVTSVESLEGILNGTAFTFVGCDLFKYYFYHPWIEFSKTNRGFYYCGGDFVLSFYSTWYFNRGSVDRNFIHEFNRKTRWLVESPQRFIREHELPQIPSWVRVFDTPLSEEKADPISVNNIMGSIFIFFGGISLACGSFIIEFSVLFARLFP